MRVRSKFKLQEIRQHAGSSMRTFIFSAVCADGTPENEKFAKYTPNGRLEFVVDNPAVIESYKLGSEYYFDSTPASVEPVPEKA